MLRTQLSIALRHLLKNPSFTLLNVFGLAIGLAVSLILMVHVRQELSFDRFHQNAGQIFRATLKVEREGEPERKLANAPNAVAPAAKDNIPAVAKSARVLKYGFGKPAFLSAGDKRLVENNVYWADPTVAEIFDFQTVAGDLKTALSQPNCLALSRSAAIRIFGTSNPVGQIVKIDSRPPLEVKAVFEDFPENSTLDGEIYGSFASEKWANDRLTWSNASFETWLLLDPAANPAEVASQLNALVEKNVEKERRWYKLELQALTDAHLFSTDLDNNHSSRLGDPQQVKILGWLALAVLVIACFNYMNLSTARSQLRFREVGINKTMGASRAQLARRFYVETAVLVGFSLLLAAVLVVVALPFFNELADKQLKISLLFNWQNLSAVLGIGAAVTLFAGSYPAVFLSSFSPKNLLQTSFNQKSDAGLLRRSLVTAQFAVSVSLIIGTVVLYQQLNFIQTKRLGFEPEQVVSINTAAAETKEQVQSLVDACRSLVSVTAVCRAQTTPGGTPSGRNVSKDANDQNGLSISTCRATPGIEKVLNIKMLAGTGLPEKLPGDTIVNVLIGKKAIEYIGWTPEEAIGKKVDCGGLGDNTIVRGVFEDFHSESLHKEITAYAFHDAETEGRSYTLVKMQAADLPGTMRQIEAAFKNALPHSAFDARFLSDHIEKLYRSDRRTANIVLVFSAISIFVSCLGLFGLAAFAAERRTKEIGIRKVLGATVAGITGLLAKDFLKLVLAAIVLATPVAYFFMEKWLENFAYRVEMKWWMFAAAGLSAVLIAFLTVGFQSVRAAIANPVKSLRGE